MSESDVSNDPWLRPYVPMQQLAMRALTLIAQGAQNDVAQQLATEFYSTPERTHYVRQRMCKFARAQSSEELAAILLPVFYQPRNRPDYLAHFKSIFGEECLRKTQRSSNRSCTANGIDLG